MPRLAEATGVRRLLGAPASAIGRRRMGHVLVVGVRLYKKASATTATVSWPSTLALRGYTLCALLLLFHCPSSLSWAPLFPSPLCSTTIHLYTPAVNTSVVTFGKEEQTHFNRFLSLCIWNCWFSLTFCKIDSKLENARRQWVTETVFPFWFGWSFRFGSSDW